MFRQNPTAGYQGYQPNENISPIKAFCTPDNMSCHPVGDTLKNRDFALLIEP